MIPTHKPSRLLRHLPHFFATLLHLLILPVVVQAQFDYISESGWIRIFRYTGSGGAVEIPGTIDGLPVKFIDGFAFAGSESVTSVTIPSSVISIGQGAFANCTSLTNVAIPNISRLEDYVFDYCTSLPSVAIPGSVASIGVAAFQDCRSLTSVTIPSGVKSIGSYAFDGCSGLTNVTIPGSVTNIGIVAFTFCTSLKAFTVDALNSYYSAVDGVLLNKSQTAVIQCPAGKTGSFTIPNGVKFIGFSAFYYCSGLTNVTIASSVTNLSHNAFNSCSGLTSLTIPNSVIRLGESVFTRCTNLSAITVGASNPLLSSANGVLFDKTKIMLIQYPGGKAGGYTIPNSVTYIGPTAFAYCHRLSNVTIPNTVTTIGSLAFSYCTGLTNLTIPNSATNIWAGAFSSCTSLARVTMPNKITTIRDSTFQDCVSLTNVIIPTNVTSIGYSAFASCTALRSVTIPTNVTSIGDSAFASCTSLTNVTIPGRVSSIGYGVFSSCTSLSSVTIPNGVTSIADVAFYSCTSLTNITIPGSVTNLGPSGFLACTNLNAITVDALNTSYSSLDGVLLNKSRTSLVLCPEGKAGSFTLPASLTNIGYYGFFYCTKLSAILVDALNPTYSSLDGVLFNKDQTRLIRCPAGRTGSYAVPNGVTRIGDAGFYHCARLTSVALPGSVNTVGNDAFSYCSSLTAVYFRGNTPNVSIIAFTGANIALVYYLPGASGWWTEFAGRPTVLWNPLVSTGDSSFGVRTNRFGFTITANSDLVIVVEATTNLSNPAWTPVGTNTLTGGASYFSDPEWTNHPARFYRLRSP